MNFFNCRLSSGIGKTRVFAGRPTDVDLGILSTKLDLFINDLNKIDKKGISRIDKFYDDENFLSKVQVLLFGEIIDISIFRPCNLENRRLWKGEYRENQKNDKKYIFIENQYLTSLSKCKLYNYNYLAPSDPEKYLENKYGDKWKVPNKKQFVWNKKF